jgi:hypothetical protein
MMKKSLFFAGLAAAALAFAGCNKEADVRGLDGVPVGIVLSNIDTRTVNDGMATKWVEDDALNVFYAPAGTQTYSDNTKFVVDDAAANHATGTAELTAEAYDWYLLYPYDSHVKTPANTNAGFLTVGSASNKTQTQAGLNSTAHLAGKNLPVYGVAKNVAVAETPSVPMKHVSSVVAVNLTNGTDKPLTVSSVSFTAPEDIVGTYYIDFSGDALGFTGSGANYVSKTATLNVTGEEAVAAGASAKFYIAIKPFTAKAGDKLVVKVLAGDDVFEKEITLPSAVEFKSGMIKQLNVTYDGGSEITPSSLTEIAAMENGTDVLTNEVLVVAKYARGVMLAQDGFYLLAFNSNGVAAKVGDIVTVSGKVGEYAGLKQISSPAVEVISSDNEVVLPEPKVLEGLDNYASDKIELIQYSGVLAVSASYFNVNVDGSTRQGSIQYPLDADALKALDKKLITATGFFTGLTGSDKYVNMMSTSVEEKAGNVFDATPTQINVAATETSAEINVTGNVDWTAEAFGGVTLDKTSGTGEAVITVSFPANEDQQNTKEYTVFVRTEATGVNDEIEINITQAKADAAGMKTVAVDFSEQGYANAKAMESETIDGITFTFAAGTNSNGPKYYTSGTAVRLYGDNSMTVSAGGKTIVSIELAFGSDDGKNAITTDVPTYEEPLWTGEAASVTFTIGGTTGQRRIKGVTVKFKDDGTTPPVATLESISVSGQKTVFTVGDTFVFDGKVTASYSDGTTKTVSPTSVSEPDMTTAGTKEVTVSYTESAVTKTAKYDITVNEKDTSLHAIVMENFASVSFTSGVYSVAAAKADAANDPVYNASGKDLRVYAKGILTVSNSKENITKIVFNLSAQGKKRLAPITASTGTIETQAAGDSRVTWTGSAREVVFTVGETAEYGTENTKPGQLCFTSMDVAPWSDGDVQPKTLSDIELSGQKLAYTLGEEFSKCQVTAVYSDGSRADVTDAATFSGFDMSVAGEQVVTVSYTEGGVTKSKTYAITITEPIVGGLSFDFSDNTVNGLDQWPSSKETSTEGTFVYVLDGVNYSFTTTKSGNGIYMNSSYLFINSGCYLGLPAIEGKKLVSVSATLNGGGNPSLSSQGTITSDTEGTVVSGGEVQTFDTKGAAKTFNLTGTSANTVYYLAIANKNFQCTKIVLIYE